MSFENNGTPPWLRQGAPDTTPDASRVTEGATSSASESADNPEPRSAGRHVDHDSSADAPGAADFDSVDHGSTATHHTTAPSWLPSMPPAPTDDSADATRWIPTVPSEPIPTDQTPLAEPAAPQFTPPAQGVEATQRSPEQFVAPQPPPAAQHFVPPQQFDPPQHFPAPRQFPPAGQFAPPQQFDQPQQFGQPQQFDQQPFPPQPGPFDQQRPPFDPGPGYPNPQFGPDGGFPPAPPQGAPGWQDNRPWPGNPQGPGGPQGNGHQGPPTGSWQSGPDVRQTPPINPANDPFGQPGAGFGTPNAAPDRSSIDEVALLRKARRAPHSGWRRAVHRISAGAINPGDSPDDLHYQQLVERVNRPVRGDYRIAVLSLKGGVGKTTTTVGLGSIYSSLRGDRVIAVDANPDLGTLGQRIPQQTRSTVRDLLADTSIYRYSDVRAHTSQSPARLEVLASERDPAVAEAFSEQDYRGVMKVLQRFYNIIITDCGTGLSHSAMNGVLDLANALILVSSPAIDGARSAGATLDWLQAHGYGHLVSRAVVVLSSSRSGASTIDTNQLSQHFLTRCRAVQMIPFDDHLAEGAEMDLDLLGKGTHRALVELAATVADDFSGTNLQRSEPYFQ